MTSTGQVPGWFDADVYFANKLAAMRATAPSYTAARLSAAFAEAGFVGDDGLYRHFVLHGADEDVSPSALFDAEQYYAAKTASYYDRGTVTKDEIQIVKHLIHEAGMNAWTHYVAFGADEGVDPSSSFDSQTYLAAKLAVIRQTNPYSTMEELVAAIRDASMTPLSHYLCHGKDEGFILDISQLAVTDPTIVLPDDLPTIELTGYKPYTLLKAEFPAGTDQGQVMLKSVTTQKGLYVSGVTDLIVYLSGENVVLEADTPYDDAIFGTTMLSTVTITGDSSASLQVEGVRAETVNASALNGSLVISLSENHATTVIGSQGNDFIETNGMADVITGGSGNDTFRIGENLGGAITAWTLDTIPTITDFSAGDVIDFSEASRQLRGFSSRGPATAVDEAELVSILRDYLSGTELGIRVVYQGGNTYLAANGDVWNTNEDVVVRLVGIYDQADLVATGYEVSIVS